MRDDKEHIALIGDVGGTNIRLSIIKFKLQDN